MPRLFKISLTITGNTPVQPNNNSSPTNPIIDLTTANNIGSSSTAAPQANNQNQAAQCAVREQDQYMPIANVIRIMRRILPPHAKISDDAKETVQECVSEYISFVTGEANDRCQREQRKTITAEDIIWAMGKLGFDDYVEPLTLFLSRYRNSENERSSARDPILKRSSNVAAMDYGNVAPLPPYVPPYPMISPPLGIFDPSTFGGYYRDVTDQTLPPVAADDDLGGSSSASNPFAHYDPFAQFK